LDCCYRIAVSVVKGCVLPSGHRLRCCLHPLSCVAHVFVTPFCSFDALLQSAHSSNTHHHILRAARLVLYDFSHANPRRYVAVIVQFIVRTQPSPRRHANVLAHERRASLVPNIYFTPTSHCRNRNPSVRNPNAVLGSPARSGASDHLFLGEARSLIARYRDSRSEVAWKSIDCWEIGGPSRPRVAVYDYLRGRMRRLQIRRLRIRPLLIRMHGRWIRVSDKRSGVRMIRRPGTHRPPPPP
jgi:hypothetical protein